MEVNGALVVRNFLTGSPQFKMVLNEDLVIVDTSHKGMSVIKYESKTYWVFFVLHSSSYPMFALNFFTQNLVLTCISALLRQNSTI